MVYDTLNNVRWADSAQTAIIADGTFMDANSEVESVTVIIESESDDDLWDRALTEEFGVIAAYVPDTTASIPTDIEIYREKLNCSRLQAKAVMYQYGILSQVEDLIAGSDFITQLAWNEATTFRRISPIIEAMKANLTWPDGSTIDDVEIDSMFEDAKAMEF